MSIQSEAMRVYFVLHGIRNSDIHEATKVDKTSISAFISGQRPVSKKAALEFSRVYGFNLNFLLTGEGELFSPSQSVQTGAIVNGGKVEGGVNITTPASPEEAALKAENEALKRENEWLRSLVEKAASKG